MTNSNTTSNPHRTGNLGDWNLEAFHACSRYNAATSGTGVFAYETDDATAKATTETHGMGRTARGGIRIVAAHIRVCIPQPADNGLNATGSGRLACRARRYGYLGISKMPERPVKQ